MRNTLSILSAALIVLAASAARTSAQSVTLLVSFTGNNGLYPFAGLAYSGNSLYGTTFGGGKYGFGDIFQLTQASPGGSWTTTILHSFKEAASEGANPFGGLLVGANGAIYGTTTRGGAYGMGAAFELAPPEQESGAWTLTLLYSFGSTANDGTYPYSGLVQDAAGNLYGTTSLGGTYGLGTVYELAATLGEGPYKEAVLHSFAGGEDVANPYAALTLGANGALYGAAPYGGGVDAGGVFALTPEPLGDWTEAVVCAFPDPDGGANPYGGVYIDANGALYGATTNGGTTSAGTVYQCSANSTTGIWSSVALYDLPSYASSYGTPVADSSGALYDTTPGAHGLSANSGIIFKLAPPTKTGGAWVETTLYTFPGDNGAGPRAGLTWGPGGDLFGTTTGLGTDASGTVYRLNF